LIPTFSIGVTLVQKGDSADTAIAIADQALYAATRTGPDAVVCLRSRREDRPTNAEASRSV
jgi:PleD family two-component response regulator